MLPNIKICEFVNIFTVRFLYYLNLCKILFVYVGIAVGAYSRKLAQLLILAKKSTKNFTLPPSRTPPHLPDPSPSTQSLF